MEQGHKVAFSSDVVRHQLSERPRSAELSLTLDHEGPVGGRESRLDLEVDAKLFEVPLSVGDDRVDDPRGGREIEPGDEGDLSCVPVGLAPLGSRVGLVVAAAGGGYQ